MPVRNGRKYLDDLDRTRREVWIGGRKITTGITEHPAFRQMAVTMSKLYDMQCDPELEDEMTYVSPSTGDRVGMSFLQPVTREDLLRRRRMMKRWADYSGGMLGRTPDYLNSDIMAMASASRFFSLADPSFGENIVNYYTYVRENDLLMTHTLINPQTNRSAPPSKQKDPFIAARIVEKRRDGIVVRGARMLATFPLADEIIVFPSTVIKSGPEDLPYSMAFAIPVDSPGLKFLCREPFCSDSRFDHPLAYGFEEMDAVVVFDDVFVPRERIFLLEDAERANVLHERTDAVVHMSHQVVTREIAKTEFILGVVSLMVETIGIGQFQHVQEKVARIEMILESLRALLIASEQEAELNSWGIMTPRFKYLNVARNVYPRLYPSIRETLQQLGASGLMAMPSSADMESEIRHYIDTYYQGKNSGAEERIRLFKLAWDIAGSSFGSRQEMYERFFFGDPVRMASAFYSWYDTSHFRKMVSDFLDRED
ncbi:MAG: 4-hydroxyphenylacetate 3-monooxygenase, oxygenase component [Thermoplasmata archaeon]|uniref:4-hydroxyphenylacetate 3-monooxygenase, oxygenase component n=1 Tax=Candidatus Sysuiplasma superficiale TaxID=2823368 RepID=A0A8J7YY20_9ARCH|nr:4-hydroxyphenylacetate 3-monooxygenase, oxygenase component [Candidatus Sysuiplasma superficiale]MBX8644511.1 4-hydroxyphenylacetate 3-monooxygenase, oxygenase component [Candidatus Sysuiplasma superficiale]